MYIQISKSIDVVVGCWLAKQYLFHVYIICSSHSSMVSWIIFANNLVFTHHFSYNIEIPLCTKKPMYPLIGKGGMEIIN